MARIDNLSNFLTDVANAIRNKNGATGVISAANFDTEINAISAGVNVEVASGTVTGSPAKVTFGKPVIAILYEGLVPRTSSTKVPMAGYLVNANLDVIPNFVSSFSSSSRPKYAPTVEGYNNGTYKITPTISTDGKTATFTSTLTTKECTVYYVAILSNE